MIIKTEIDEIRDYLTDASCFEGHCDRLYIAETKEEIIEIVKRSNESGEKLTVSAAGTGLTGSRVPLGGGILSMERLNKILQFNKNEKYLIVEPFVKITEIDEYLQGSGLFYPPNPTEKLSSIGGNIANNASGSRTYKYGATRHYIEQMDLILPFGDTLNLKRGEILANGYSFSFHTNEGTKIEFTVPKIEMPKVKHAAAYYIKENMDLIDLIIGGEGTLGIVTSARLKLIDKAEKDIGAVVFFESHDRCYDFISNIRSANSTISPILIEFFDDNSLKYQRTKVSQIPDNAKYALWIEMETTESAADATTETLYELITQHSDLADETWFAQNSAEHKRLAEFRHALPLAVYEDIQQYKQQKLGTDTAVPDEHIKSYHEYIINLFEKNALEYVIWGHIGNSHLHANIITKSDEEFAKALVLFENIVQKAVDLGGTVSAEHGIGKIKKQFLKMLYSEPILRDFAKIKKAFDPNMILNIGNMFD